MLNPMQVLVTVDFDSDLGYVWTCWAPVNENETLHDHAESEDKAIRRMLCPGDASDKLTDDAGVYTALFNKMRSEIKVNANPGDAYWTRYISPEDYKCDCYTCDSAKYFKISDKIKDELDDLEYLYIDLIYDLYADSRTELTTEKIGWFKLHYDDLDSTHDGICSYLPVFDTILISDEGLSKFIAHIEYYYSPLVIMSYLIKNGHNPKNYIRLPGGL